MASAAIDDLAPAPVMLRPYTGARRLEAAQRTTVIDFAIGDVLYLRKPHPCGSHEWTVTRIGADIGIRCHGCSRRVLIPRSELERRTKTRTPAHAEDAT